VNARWKRLTFKNRGRPWDLLEKRTSLSTKGGKGTELLVNEVERTHGQGIWEAALFRKKVARRKNSRPTGTPSGVSERGGETTTFGENCLKSRNRVHAMAEDGRVRSWGSKEKESLEVRTLRLV